MEKKKDRKKVIVALGVLLIVLLMQGGYYFWIYINLQFNKGPESYRRYGVMQAVDPNTPHLKTTICIRGYSLAQVQHYFNDIALSDEAKTCTDIVRKWLKPITVYIIGTPSESDWQVMEKLFEDMNAIEGFPGISIVSSEEDANFIGYFYAEDEYVSLMDEIKGYRRSNGTSQLDWSEESGVISGGLFAVRSDLDDALRHTVILEEIVQAMGLQNDSYAHPDSLFYQKYHENTDLSDLDWIIFRILYHPMIQCGMNYSQCVPALAFILQQ